MLTFYVSLRLYQAIVLFKLLFSDIMASGTSGTEKSSITQMVSKSTEDKVSAAQQIALSLLAVGGSMITGMYVTARREKMKMKNVIGAGTPAVVASKALLIGSAYSIGTFAVGTALFVMTTGVTSFQEFAEYVDRTFRTPEGYRRVQEKRERERQELEQLSRKYSHLSKTDLLWKQLRIKEELQNEEDEEDEQIISSPEQQAEMAKQRELTEAKAAEKEHYNVVLVAFQNLKKVLGNVKARLIGGDSAAVSSVDSDSDRVSATQGNSNVGDKEMDRSIKKAMTTARESPLVDSKDLSVADQGGNLLVRKWNKLVDIWSGEEGADGSRTSQGKEEPTH